MILKRQLGLYAQRRETTSPSDFVYPVVVHHIDNISEKKSSQSESFEGRHGDVTCFESDSGEGGASDDDVYVYSEEEWEEAMRGEDECSSGSGDEGSIEERHYQQEKALLKSSCVNNIIIYK